MTVAPQLKRIGLLVLVALLIATTVGARARSAEARRNPTTPRPTIVLVHGAFADASGWNAVTQRLQQADYEVVAVANPLRSVDHDASYVRSVLDTIDGPVVLVGHSYGGFVITNAAAGDPDIEALVYVAAFAPAPGDTVETLTAMNPGSGLLEPGNLVVRPHPTGADGYINPTVFRDIFAADLSRQETDVMAASQRPADVGTLREASGPAAWETIPSWYVVASRDRTIPPATQRFMADRANSITTEIRSSHVVMMSHPRRVASIIEQAAKTVD